jgi:drug/metabolite transporter (DMT)-like permease
MGLLLITIAGASWGISAMLNIFCMKYTNQYTIVCIRLLVAGVFIYLVCSLKGIKVFKKNYLPRSFLLGILNSMIPLLCFAISAKYLDSGTISILNGSFPLFSLIMTSLILKEKNGLSSYFGVLLGLVGIYIIYLKHKMSPNPDDEFAVMIILVATFFYSIAGVFTRAKCKDINPLANASLSALCASLATLPFFLYNINYEVFLNTKFLIAIISMGIFCTAVPYICYFTVVERYGAQYAATSALLIPVFGSIYGILIMNEEMTWNKIAGGALILVGLAFILLKKRIK